MVVLVKKRREVEPSEEGKIIMRGLEVAVVEQRATRRSMWRCTTMYWRRRASTWCMHRIIRTMLHATKLTNRDVGC